MDGTLGSETARLLDGSGVEITSRASSRRSSDVRRRRAGRWPCSDRRPRQPRGARRLRGDAGGVGAARPAAAHRARPAPRARRTSAGSPSSEWPPRSSSATRRPTATSPSGSGPGRRTAPTPTARSGTSGRRRRERVRRADRGARSAGRDRRRCAAHAGRPTGLAPRAGARVEEALAATCVTPAWLAYDEHRRGKLIPGYLADLVVLDRDPFAIPPGGAAGSAGGGDDGRRPLDPQPAALGLLESRGWRYRLHALITPLNRRRRSSATSSLGVDLGDNADLQASARGAGTRVPSPSDLSLCATTSREMAELGAKGSVRRRAGRRGVGNHDHDVAPRQHEAVALRAAPRARLVLTGV